ncbi:MAG: hypothetical protein ABSD10_00235 [Candidatus Saccharimonadales bacterium]|jgi:hypothetical protein
MHWLYDFFWVVWVLALLLIIAYGAVIAFGAPFLPTLRKTRAEAIKLINLKEGQLLVDLGSGDGSVLSKAAASGLRAVGYELNPFLFIYSWIVTRRYGRRVKVVLGNFWHADISEADGIFVFLIGHYMEKLDKFITGQPHKKLKVVSHGFEIPSRTPIKKQGALFLYEYPASRQRRE